MNIKESLKPNGCIGLSIQYHLHSKAPPLPQKKTSRYQPMTKEYTALVVDTNIAYDTYMEKFNIFSSK